MRNSKSKTACEKRRLKKCDELFRAYSRLQSVYGDMLETDDSVASFRANVLLTDFEPGDSYTTDFVITKDNGTQAVRECVPRKRLTKPLQVKLLDASFRYWRDHGITDFGIVIDKDEEEEQGGA